MIKPLVTMYSWYNVRGNMKDRSAMKTLPNILSKMAVT